jgi:hypothetical protein
VWFSALFANVYIFMPPLLFLVRIPSLQEGDVEKVLHNREVPDPGEAPEEELSDERADAGPDREEEEEEEEGGAPEQAGRLRVVVRDTEPAASALAASQKPPKLAGMGPDMRNTQPPTSIRFMQADKMVSIKDLDQVE